MFLHAVATPCFLKLDIFTCFISPWLSSAEALTVPWARGLLAKICGSC